MVGDLPGLDQNLIRSRLRYRALLHLAFLVVDENSFHNCGGVIKPYEGWNCRKEYETGDSCPEGKLSVYEKHTYIPYFIVMQC